MFPRMQYKDIRLWDMAPCVSVNFCNYIVPVLMVTLFRISSQ
jgi:hypothetical protein